MDNSTSEPLNAAELQKNKDSTLENNAKHFSKQINKEFPEKLQAATKMDLTNNFRLPSEKQQILPPPMKQSRSVKEYEEQMSELRKENFNLKLRLYFLEENIPGYHANNIEGTENLVMKQLLDAKVEMESLRGEIQEKQNLLKEAIKAMNKMEEERSHSEAKAFETIAELKNRLDLQAHDSNLTLFRSTNVLNSELNISAQAQKIRDLEDRLKQSENKVADFQNQIDKLDDILTQRDNTIEEYEEKMKNLVFKNDQQLETINDMEMQLLNNQKILKKTCETNASLKQDNEKLLRTLKSSTEHFNNEAVNIEICEKQMQEQQEALCKMQCQKEIQDLKAELANKTCLLQEVEEKLNNRFQTHEKACRTIQKLMINIRNQEEEINSLKKLKLLNSYLVFTEDSKKNTTNNEINDSKRMVQAEKTTTILNEELKIHTDLQNINVIEPTNAKRTIEIVNDSPSHTLSLSLLDVEDKKDVLITQLRTEIQKAHKDTEAAENIKRECIHMCNILSNHLEELADFLNSLLNHKDILSILSADKRYSLRKMVDKSLDLSKLANESLSVSNISTFDFSVLLPNCTHCSTIELSNEENITFNSNENLSINRLLKTEKLENQLFNKIDKSLQVEKQKEFAKSPERIEFENTGAPIEHEQQCLVNEIQQQERIVNLEQILAKRDQYISEIQKLLNESSNRTKQDVLLISNLKLEVEQLLQRNEKLQTSVSDFEVREKKMTENINIHKYNLEKLIKENENLIFVAEQTDRENKDLKLKFSNTKDRYEKALKNAEEHEKFALNQLKSDFDAKLKEQLLEKENHFKETLETNWISRNLFDELDNLYSEAKQTIEKLHEDKMKLNKLLNDNEIFESFWRKQSTRGSLQTFNANLQRSKSFNEKMLLHKTFNENQLNENKNQQNDSFKRTATLNRVHSSAELGIETNNQFTEFDAKEHFKTFKDVNSKAERVYCTKNITHDCAEIENENAELRRKLKRNKLVLVKTFEKLCTANQRKAQIEKEIGNQILKTQNILKNVRSIMEHEM